MNYIVTIVHCLQHKDELYSLYISVIHACITASSHIPRISQSRKVIPGWNDEARNLREEALSWHHFWNIHGCLRDDYLAEMHRITRARYRRTIRQLK